MRRFALRRAMAIAARRAPDFFIGGKDNPYLRRWWLIPRNRWFNVYLHHFMRSDDDRALHDHPYLWNASWLLDGGYLEHLPGDVSRKLEVGAFKFRWGAAPHRVELDREWRNMFLREAPAWTIFVSGPRVRNWGFYCEHGWISWQAFTSPRNKGEVGRGCE